MTSSFSFLLGILSALFGAAANLSARKLVNFASARDTISVSFALMFLLLTPLAPILFALQVEPFALLLLLAAILIDGVANLLYFKAFEINDAATASALLALSPLFTLLLLPVANISNSALHPLQLLGIVIVVFGLFLLSRTLPARDGEKQKAPRWQRLLIPLLGALLFGGNVYLTKYLLTTQIVNPFTYYYLRALLIAVLTYLALRPDHRWITRPRLLFTAGRALLVIAQWLLLLYALDWGSPALIKAASDSSPLFVVLLAPLALHEPVTRQKVVGSLVLIAGLALIALG